MEVKCTGPTLNPLPKTRHSRFLRSFVKLQRKRSKSEVVPLGPSLPSRRSISGINVFVSGQQPVKGRTSPLTFRESFGLMGLPMILMVLGCIAWTLWLLVLTVAPNAAANYLMDTSAFDDGQFWLIPDELTTLQILSAAGLVLVLFLYFYVLMEMLVWRSETNSMQTKMNTFVTAWEAAATAKAANSVKKKICKTISSVSWKMYKQWKDYTGIYGKNRKFWNLFLKIHDLVMLSLMLRDLLETGMPVRITYGFAAMAAMNSLSCAVGIGFQRSTALAEILVDSLFDFGSTVIYPLVVLKYCSDNFHYDRAVFAINMELLPIGSFERRARMYANPAEIALVRTSFDSIRILDYTDLFLRVGMNLAFSYRCKRIVDVLIDIKTQQYTQREAKAGKVAELQPVYFSFPTSSVKNGNRQQPVPRYAALFFLAYSVGVLVTAHKAVTTSQSVCSSHPQCVVYAYRWRDLEFCPCRAIVDGNPAPRTYYEWTHPVDATETVEKLAAAGTLETLRLVNRQLTTLPDELQGCQNLNLVSLINSATKELPGWMRNLTSLQYLQVEGKSGSENLGNLDPALFSNMPELRYLQFGVQSRMTQLPPLNGAPNLRSIILSRMYNMAKFPALTNQARLERLELCGCTTLQTLPDLKPVIPLVHFVIFQGGEVCCNGFLGACDLSSQYCKNSTCLDPSLKATSATLQVVSEFSNAVCLPRPPISQVPTRETIEMCEGVPYKQCRLPGLTEGTWVTGMCYNHRMQVLACNPDPDKIQVRRRQIQENVGVPCNPAVESWLGCKR